MPRVTVTVNGRVYDLACDDGEEAHVIELARQVDERIARLVSTLGQAGESRLLLLASLLMTHELTEARKNASSPSSSRMADDQGALLNGIETLIDRMEAIAARLEAS